VLWLRSTSTGKLAPIDAFPSPDGNVVVHADLGTYDVVKPEPEGLFAGDGAAAAIRPRLHLNHWVTCTNATARRLAKERQKGHTGPLVTVDGDPVNPHGPRTVPAPTDADDPLAPPLDVLAKHHRCPGCDLPVDAALLAAGISRHPACS
jgi:hypothetical protein